MKLLAWDTSSVTGTVVASEWDSARPLSEARLLAEWTLNVETSHSDGLLSAIHQVLGVAGWDLSQVDVYGVGIGPGSFTGLRIGLTTVRTWAEAMKKPVVGVCSLSVLSRPLVRAARGRGAVVVARNAFGGETYVLSGRPDALLKACVPAQKGFKSAWPREVRLETVENSQFAKTYGKAAKANPKLPFSDVPQGRVLAELCWEAVKSGCARQAQDIQPLYMRDSSAQVKMARGELKVSPTDS